MRVRPGQLDVTSIYGPKSGEIWLEMQFFGRPGRPFFRWTCVQDDLDRDVGWVGIQRPSFKKPAKQVAIVLFLYYLI